MTRRNIFRSFIGLALTRFGHADPGEQASRPTLLIPSTLGKEGGMATGGGSVPHGSGQSASSRLLPNKGQDNRDWTSGMSEPTGCQPGAINSVSLPSELDIPAWLRQWHQAPMISVIESADPFERTLIAHQFANASLTIHYANSSDGSRTPRSITPILLFEKDDYPDSTYLLAWCHSRKAPRVFKTAHITLE